MDVQTTNSIWKLFMYIPPHTYESQEMCSDTLWRLIQRISITSFLTLCVSTSLSNNVGFMKNNLTSQQLHTAPSIWFTREVKIPECCSPKPQHKLLLLHQTSPLVTIITASLGGENKACSAQECMETRGAQSPEIQLHRKAHSSWLTILIPPSFIRSPTMWSCCHGPSSLPHTEYHRQGNSQTCNDEGSLEGQSRSNHDTFAQACSSTKTTQLQVIAGQEAL